MAKAKTNDKQHGAKLSALSVTIAKAFGAHEQTGNLMLDICKSVQNLYHGADIPAADSEFLLDEVARLRGWTAKSGDKRKSEAKAVLKAYAKLPAAIERATSRKVPVPFYKAVALARYVNAGKTPIQAADALVNGNASNKVAPKDRKVSEAWKSVSTHLNRVLEHTQLPKAFRAEVRALAARFEQVALKAS